jgi:hypothetical protein
MENLEELRSESSEIGELLEELHDIVDPEAWCRVEQVLHRLVRLYGTGLAHTLDHARSAGADERFDALLTDDTLLSSLLVVHGLHPLTTEERILRALAALRDRLEASADDLVLVGVERGVAHLHANPAIAELTGDIRRLVEAVAPEITSIQIATSTC